MNSPTGEPRGSTLLIPKLTTGHHYDGSSHTCHHKPSWCYPPILQVVIFLQISHLNHTCISFLHHPIHVSSPVEPSIFIRVIKWGRIRRTLKLTCTTQTEQCILWWEQIWDLLSSEEQENAVCSVYVPFSETNSLTRCASHILRTRNKYDHINSTMDIFKITLKNCNLDIFQLWKKRELLGEKHWEHTDIMDDLG
jgi:hypothetical protein